MSYPTCEYCGKSGETDDDGGVWYGKRYTCAACVKILKEDEDAPDDEPAKAKETMTKTVIDPAAAWPFPPWKP